jgi:hypothetical protein
MATQNKVKGSAFTPPGTMPVDKLKRFKLSGNMVAPNLVSKSRNTQQMARAAMAMKIYRQVAHGCTEPRLPASLRQSLHYFAKPLSRSDSDNPRDRKGMVETEVQK